MRPTLAEAHYRVRHGSLALALGPMLGLWHRSLSPRHAPPQRSVLLALRRRFQELLARDLANVEAGLYPKDLLFDPPLWRQIQVLPEALADLPQLWRRARRHGSRELPKVEASDYPDYYLRNFHWQTDGWLSDRSARLYDLQVEFLFFGTLGIMRRMAIPPLVRALSGRRGARLLDVGCGTGRFLRQLHRALPEAKLYGLDLSPFYLREAGRELAEVQCLSLLQENAEAIPLEAASLAAASSTFLFHELPPESRRRVLRELFRLLAPGGTVVLCDALQQGDPGAGELGFYLDWFPTSYHEPYYTSYLADELGALLTEAGFTVLSRESHLLAKLVVARKP